MGSLPVCFSSYRSSHDRGHRCTQHELPSQGNSSKAREKSTSTIPVLTQKIFNMQIPERITKQPLHLNTSIDELKAGDELKGWCCTCGGCGSILS